ncbi:MAG: aminopeptidase N, partial [Hyphomicrobiales bacterium]|nr:aminopeptidase N [Hyphomicrobiales bacterium]
KRAMRWDEEKFGREYDLDIFMIVAVSDFNMGAMENKGLNIFNDACVLGRPETATDGTIAFIERVVGHEYFHNWTGDRITCRDWFQLCLKEGFTVYRDQEFTSDQRSRVVTRIGDVRALRTHQFVEDAGPLAHPVRPALYHEINNFYTSTVYEKGAEVVRMLSALLGGDGFRRGMDLYFKRHDGHAATVEDFIACFADANGADLSQFMRWYAQAGTPELAVTGRFDRKSKTFRLDVAQTVPPTPGQPVKEPMMIPLALGLVGADGRDLPLVRDDGAPVERGVLTISQHAESFTFAGIAERPALSLNRGFAAPIKVSLNAGADDLKFLAAHDSDPFNRWQAVQSLATGILIDGAVGRAGKAQADAGLIDALTAILGDQTLEPAFVAQALTLPSEADIARDIGRDVNPDAVFAARKALRVRIGQVLHDALAAMHRRMSDNARYSPDAASAGRRALKNACLDLLAAEGAGEGITLAVRQFTAADNMTDRMAALTTLSLHDRPERAEALAEFYRRYDGDALVIDKWFALQAAIPEHATLDRVRKLTAHPAFSFANPNRLRALIGAFAQLNQTQFNRPDGAGYAFLADTVLAVDPKNPQVAARLLSAFKSWRALEAGRRARAEATLRRVAAAENLSRDVSDIVTRALGQT